MTKKLGTERGREIGSSSDGRFNVDPDAGPLDEHRDPRAGTAAIPPVTGATMDHAAHEAAVLADGVAHHTVTLESAQRSVGAAGDAAATAAEAARDAVGTAAGAAEAARMSVSASADAIEQCNAKVIEALRTNMAATNAHVAALVQAKSVSEAASLSADHVWRQIGIMTVQTRELATLAQQAAFEAFRPFRDSMKRS